MRKGTAKSDLQQLRMSLGNDVICASPFSVHELIVASTESIPATIFHGAYKDSIGSILGNHIGS